MSYDYELIEITHEDKQGLHYKKIGELNLNLNFCAPSTELLSNEIYKFLLKNKTNAEIENIAVVSNKIPNERIPKIIWLGGYKKELYANYRVKEIEEYSANWKTFITIDKISKETKNRIHNLVNFNQYSFEPQEAVFSWYPDCSFFNLENALNFVNRNKSHKYWIWHTERENNLEVLHIDYWEGEVKENFTERDLWSMIAKDREAEEIAFKKEEERKRLAEEEWRIRREAEERKRIAKYAAENPWYYLEVKLKELNKEANELNDKLNNRWDESSIRTCYNSHYDVYYQEGESVDLLGNKEAERIKKRLGEIGDREKEIKAAILDMKDSKRISEEKKKQEEYYSKVDNLTNLLKDPVIAERMKELKRKIDIKLD